VLLKAAALALAAGTITSVGPAENGRSITVQRGTKLVVALPANASTGYAWRIVSKPTPVLRLVSQRYVRAKSKLIGAHGQYVATFVARTSGSTVLRLAYMRTTHPPSRPAQRYRLTVAVR
jgi:predicted secreted protein